MTTIKSYTSLEQSKKLTEILPLESADMLWEQHGVESYVTIKPYTTIGKSIRCHCLNCWSLAALLDILPKNLHTVLAIGEQEKYAIGSTDTNKYDCIADNPVDACVAMIIKLYELKKL